MVDRIEALRQLRAETGVGLGVANDALVAADGDLEKAMEILGKLPTIESSLTSEGRGDVTVDITPVTDTVEIESVIAKPSTPIDGQLSDHTDVGSKHDMIVREADRISVQYASEKRRVNQRFQTVRNSSVSGYRKELDEIRQKYESARQVTMSKSAKEREQISSIEPRVGPNREGIPVEFVLGGLWWGFIPIVFAFSTGGAVAMTGAMSLRFGLKSYGVYAVGIIALYLVAKIVTGQRNQSRETALVRHTLEVDDRLRYSERRETEELVSLKQSEDAELAALEASAAKKNDIANTQRDEAFRQLGRESKDRVKSLTAAVENYREIVQGDSSPDRLSASWISPTTMQAFQHIGTSTVSAINASYSIPAAIALPAGMSFLLLAPSTSGATIDETLVVRIVQAFPPGRLRLTLFDPVGNGSNFAGLMHLGEHNPALIGSAAWVDSRHIEEQLASLSEQMRTIIQKYLRRDYETMEEYNAAAQQIEEPYRLLVINNFPTGFSQNAINSLRHILSNGRRAGIYTMIALDQSAELPRGFKVSELEAAVNHVIYRGADGDKIAAAGTSYKAEFQPLEPLPNAVVKAILEQISQESLAVGNVVVPFTDVAPSTDKWWTGNSQDSLSPVVGFHGARKPQQINLGRNTLGGDLNNGALIVGRVGSGKSTLLHSIIMGLATQYGPDELELYLIDSKQGIEFNTYARHHLPHARAISVETEPEFTASVILRLAEEMEIRAKRIKARVGETGSSQNIRGFREISDEKMPRVVLVIDEFQELYRESSPRITAAQQALEQIIRQGRAYGIHLILATQTFGGGVGMPKAIRELVAVRIAMMSSESDAAMIFQDDNTEARLLDRPGEAILNENFGKVESNQRFQTAWMESDERDELLEQLRAKADAEFPMLPKPSVFFGGTSSALAENPALATVAVGGTPRVWLGTSIAIEPDYEVALSQKAGANLLMVGTQEATLGMLVSAVTAAAITSPTAIIRIVDAGGEDAGITDHLEALTSLSDRDIRVVAQRSAPAIIEEIDTELTRRLEMDSTRTLPAIVLVLPMIDRVRSLRRDANSGYGTSATEFNPVKAFARILTEGAEVGIHVIAQAESLSSLNRVLTAQQLDQFDTRVVTQVSREDSQRLIDNPEASNLGENRAVVFQDDRNRRSKIKPYGLPDLDWMKQVLTQSRKVAD